MAKKLPSKIVITGTPGTGKTTVAKLLSRKLRLPVTHITNIVKEKKLGIGKEKGSIVVDMKKLQKELEKRTGLIEGHLACEFPLKSAVVIVLRCNPNVLKKRMQKRGYSSSKIMENLEAEALDYCTINAEKHYKTVFEVDTSKKDVDKVAEHCIGILDGKRKSDKVDFSEYLPIKN